MIKSSAFTLIELLVTITLIGLLIGTISLSYSNIQEKNRDNRRKTDLSSISNALDNFYQDKRTYPKTPNPTDPTDVNLWAYTDFIDGSGRTNWIHQSPYVPNNQGTFETVYLKQLPHDPYFDPNVYNYNGYMYQSNGTNYTVWAFNTVEAQSAVPSSDDFYTPGTGSWTRSYRVIGP